MRFSLDDDDDYYFACIITAYHLPARCSFVPTQWSLMLCFPPHCLIYLLCICSGSETLLCLSVILMYALSSLTRPCVCVRSCVRARSLAFVWMHPRVLRLNPVITARLPRRISTVTHIAHGQGPSIALCARVRVCAFARL